MVTVCIQTVTIPRVQTGYSKGSRKPHAENSISQVFGELECQYRPVSLLRWEKFDSTSWGFRTHIRSLPASKYWRM